MTENDSEFFFFNALHAFLSCFAASVEAHRDSALATTDTVFSSAWLQQ